ncbi:CRISPR-associated endonuclease Cas6 [Oceanivirga salmonicida]|uniref:CRISPR-associated endonuclease Cas6 n=1 Tax=Oceanivirga salmonicida TaxID=1769291 RepID=UPI0012E17C6B|nr:CRISPR-associated endonuclease Cas6 [Oceanivirga salmonicida]
MKIIYSIVSFEIDKKLKFIDISKLRGNMISKFNDNLEIHNHKKNGESIYNFPNIQYKLINNKLTIMSFKQDLNLLMSIRNNVNKLDFDGEIVEIKRKNIEIKEYDLKYLRNDFIEYTFLSTYLPFNQVNYEKYKNGLYSLEKAITNNLLEFLKGVKYFLEENERIIVSDINIKSEKVVKNKNIGFNGYKLSFKTNLDLPNYISLGKRKSIGYGVIKKVKSQ